MVHCHPTRAVRDVSTKSSLRTLPRSRRKTTALRTIPTSSGKRGEIRHSWWDRNWSKSGWRVPQQVVAYLAIGVQVAADQVFACLVAKACGGGGDDPLDIVLVRIDQETHERLLVIRFVGDVGQRLFIRLRLLEIGNLTPRPGRRRQSRRRPIDRRSLPLRPAQAPPSFLRPAFAIPTSRRHRRFVAPATCCG